MITKIKRKLRLTSNMVPANKEERKRCRWCMRDLSIGEFDHNRQVRLVATCTMCLVSDFLLEAIREENWQKGNKYNLYRLQHDSHKQRW